ncbi:hypothetical protein [Herbaspirillum sp. alder98]|uniref:hypothetical protein n=1 Tax=Herbaspirillum sp. alder98 TaxID=2913096 RepID=UPI001CD8D1E2|nr:hypothetical protein [Herbaspirillum sp. alder98]MCA1323643.1 hypothetical protein [Herbaspirillum sp. alder98]
MTHPDLNDQQRRLLYAQELQARFAAYRQWAIEHWPVAEQPLTESAFVAARRELELMTGAMLHPGEKPRDLAAPPAAGGAQYEDVTPAPWP